VHHETDFYGSDAHVSCAVVEWVDGWAVIV